MRPLHSLLVLVVLTAVTGCGDSHEKVVVESIDLMNNTTAVLKTITDVPTAKAAGSKLQQINEQIPPMRDRSEKLGQQSRDEKAALMKQYLPQQKAAFDAFNAEFTRIATLGPEVRAEIEPRIANFVARRDRGNRATTEPSP